MAWEKGTSGNPNGRPRGSKVLAPEIRRIFSSDEERASFARAMVDQAKAGNPKAIEVCRYALDGPELKAVAVESLSNEQVLDLLALGTEETTEEEVDGAK